MGECAGDECSGITCAKGLGCPRKGNITKSCLVESNSWICSIKYYGLLILSIYSTLTMNYTDPVNDLCLLNFLICLGTSFTTWPVHFCQWCKYSGDLNSEHLRSWNIWIANLCLFVFQMVCYSDAQYHPTGHLKSRWVLKWGLNTSLLK